MLSVLRERVGAGDTREPSTDDLHNALSRSDRRRHSSFGSWLDVFRDRTRGGFFPGTEQMSETARLAREVDADGVAQLIRQADRALDGHLTLLGYADVNVGRTIDWHRDTLRQITAPRSHWSRIPFLEPEIVGDHKLIWEINRHQWLVTLAQAWVYTGDDRYVTAIADAMKSWMDANPPKLGVNWASSLEVAFRSISWLWVLRIVGRHPMLPDELIARTVGHLWIAARHIMRHLSTYFSANTHLTGEALALYYLGGELGGFSEARRWRETGRAILLEQLPIQVRNDGTYFEQSTWYHRYTLDFYLHFCILEERAGRDVPQARAALEQLAHVLLWVMRPDGTMPLIGDDDGGRLLSLDARAASDARPALANVAALVGNATLASAGTPSAELAWLMGVEGVEAYRRLPPRPPEVPSHHFSAGGMIVLRDGWGHDASVMTLDVGEHGVMKGGHSHADALAVDLTIRGLPVLVDPGTLDYTTNPTIRDRFRHTASHNAVTIDGYASSEMAGPFAWRETATTTLSAFVSTPRADYVDASHDGYLWRPARARYHRQLVFLRHGIWIFRDSVHADQDCRMEVHFQCAAGIAAAPVAGGVKLSFLGQDRATLHFADEGTTVNVVEGMVSPLYGLHERAPHLVISDPFAARHVLHTVVASADLGVRKVHLRQLGEGSILEIERSGELDVVGFGAGDSLHQGDVVLEADAWYVRRDAGGEVTYWMAAGCRKMELGGESLASSVRGTEIWGDTQPHAAAVEPD